MALQTGKDANYTITGTTTTGVTITKWTLSHSVNFHTYMAFGDSVPRNEEINSDWSVSMEGFVNADASAGTIPAKGAEITALELNVDSASTLGYELPASASAKVSEVSVEAPADGVVSFSFTIVPNGYDLQAYGDTSV